MMANRIHTPVLIESFLELGFPASGKTFVDVTFGMGGHTKALIEKFTGIKHCIGIDQDQQVLDLSKASFSDPRVTRFHGRASQIRNILEKPGLDGTDGILMDLGVSSLQLDRAERGFSFMHEGPLDMRMDTEAGVTACDIVNEYPAESLTEIFFKFGEERFSRLIAEAIVKERSRKPVKTTAELAGIIEKSIPARFRKKSAIHPATRVFQAIRIVVNNELDELEAALPEFVRCLKPGGRLSVIAFHSLEDRIVKNFFKAASLKCVCPPVFPVCRCNTKPSLRVVNPKPITANDSECETNPRARSAKLRIAEKLQE